MCWTEPIESLRLTDRAAMISIARPSRSLIKVYRKICHHVRNYWLRKKPCSKLYSILVYDKIAQAARKSKYSLQTLCCSLHIFEEYCRLEYQDDGIDEEQSVKIALACLDISAVLNETKSQFQLSMQNQQTKLSILKKLEWSVNYPTFFSFSSLFVQWVEDLEEFETKNVFVSLFLKNLKNSSQGMLNDFRFLEEDPISIGNALLKTVMVSLNINLELNMDQLFSEGQPLTIETFPLHQPQSQVQNCEQKIKQKYQNISKFAKIRTKLTAAQSKWFQNGHENS